MVSRLRQHRFLSIAIVTLAAAAALATVRAGQALTSSPAVPEVFVDDGGTVTVSLVLDGTAPNAGRFTFSGPQGTYSGGSGSALVLSSNQTAAVNWQGTATFLPAGTTGNSTTPAQAVPGVTVAGHASVPLHVATLTLTVGTNVVYVLNATSSHPGGPVISHQAETAFSTEDWGTLYSLLPAVEQAQITSSAFATSRHQQETSLGTITAKTPQDAGTETVNDMGQRFFIITEQVTRTSVTGPTVKNWKLQLIWDGGAWKLWASAPV